MHNEGKEFVSHALKSSNIDFLASSQQAQNYTVSVPHKGANLILSSVLEMGQLWEKKTIPPNLGSEWVTFHNLNKDIQCVAMSLELSITANDIKNTY